MHVNLPSVSSAKTEHPTAKPASPLSGNAPAGNFSELLKNAKAEANQAPAALAAGTSPSSSL